MVFVCMSNQVRCDHHIHALLNHRPAASLPDAQFDLQVIGLVKGIQESVLVLCQFGIVWRFLSDVVVVGADKLSVSSQLLAEPLVVKIVLVSVLLQYVVKVASVNENHHSAPCRCRELFGLHDILLVFRAKLGSRNWSALLCRARVCHPFVRATMAFSVWFPIDRSIG